MSFGRRTLLRTLTVAPVALFAVVLGACAGEYPQNVFEPVTEFGAQINDLFGLIFWLTMAILAIVLSVLFYIVIRFRHRPGAPPPKKIYGNNVAEILWTLGPAIIVAVIVVPTVRTIFKTYEPVDGDPMVVEVIGHQWWWEYRYPELGVVTANQLHVPVGQPVELHLWTADVLHSWWVPRLGGKRDNFPKPQSVDEQAPNWHVLRFTVDEAGEYSGQCAEYCGLAHAIMRTMVVAQQPDEFEAWVSDMKASGVPGAAAGGEALAAGVAGAAQAPQQAVDPQVQRGYEVFTRSACVACHTIEGTNAQGKLGPNLTNFGDRWSIGAGMMDNTKDNLVRWIKDPSSIKPGTKMPGADTPGGGLPPTGLSDEEIEAVAAYLLSLK